MSALQEIAGNIISIHAPREGGDYFCRPAQRNPGISIHAPREGGDPRLCKGRFAGIISIHAPREGGDLGVNKMVKIRVISIHAPREGGDHTPPGVLSYQHNFNPRPPRGGRLPSMISQHGLPPFQSTPPARGATLFILF